MKKIKYLIAFLFLTVIILNGVFQLSDSNKKSESESVLLTDSINENDKEWYHDQGPAV